MCTFLYIFDVQGTPCIIHWLLGPPVALLQIIIEKVLLELLSNQIFEVE